MTFCPNCGKELKAGDKFCSGCGTPVQVDDPSKRKEVFEGSIHKCPNCGEIIGSFTPICPTCGFEFRDSRSSSAVKEFATQLQMIESKRKPRSAFSGIATALGAKDSINEQKINLIKSFAVPNTKEDVFEFMILASSNIDESVYENNNKYSPEKSVSDAWMAKADQVYHKAELSFRDDPDFARIQSIYDSKMKAVHRKKMMVVYVLIGAILFLVLDFGLIGFMSCSENKKEVQLEKQLNATVVEIQEDIADGDYDSALVKANGLHFDKSLDSEKAKQWDEQRENIIELINEKKAED